MTNKCLDQTPKEIFHWGFEQWQELYQKNPDLYDQYRKQLLIQLVEEAPENQKERLNGLLFTMEGEKRRSSSIEAEQARYYALMMDSLSELNNQLSSLFHLEKPLNKKKYTSAKVLEFKTKNKHQ